MRRRVAGVGQMKSAIAAWPASLTRSAPPVTAPASVASKVVVPFVLLPELWKTAIWPS
jgi:hypothetical protein